MISRSVLLSKPMLAGWVFVVIGLAGFFGSQSYDLGTATNMGPGYFPRLLAILMIMLGCCALIEQLIRRRHEIMPVPNVKPLLFVVCGVALFGALIDAYGLVAAVAASSLVFCYDRLRRRKLEALLIAAILSGFTALLFIYILQLPFRLF